MPLNFADYKILIQFRQGDHSWRDIIDQQERERRRQAAYAARMKEPAGALA